MADLQLVRKDGLYVPADQVNDLGQVVLAVLYAEEPDEPLETVTLLETWEDPEAPNLYAFFPAHPGISDGEWQTFAKELIKTFRDALASDPEARFGWFDAAGKNADNLYITVRSQGNQVFMVRSPLFEIAEVGLRIGTGGSFVIDPPTDGEFVFNVSGRIETNSSASGRAPVAEPVRLPMAVPARGAQGAWSFSVEFNDFQLRAVETGCVYFQEDPPNNALNHYYYPVFRPLQEGGQVGFFGSWDINAGLDTTRTFFDFNLEPISSYFTDTLGQPVRLTPASGSTLCFVLRPNFVGDDSGSDLYLAPQGRFEMAPATVLAEGAEAGYGFLFGLNGSEYMNFTATEESPETGGVLVFTRGQPAWDNTVGGTEGRNATASRRLAQARQLEEPSAVYLANPGGIYSTSWIQVEPSEVPTNEYSAQPEASLLFASIDIQQPGVGGSLLNFHQAGVDFGSGDDIPAMPEVPSVPYSGIDPLTLPPPLSVESYAALESTVLYPARREVLNSTAVIPPLGDPLRTITPPGLLVELSGKRWNNLLLGSYEARGGAKTYLALDQMGPTLQTSLKQSRFFNVVSTVVDHSTTPEEALFDFSRDAFRISGWTFRLSPGDGVPVDANPEDPTTFPPILLMKFYQGETIKNLVDTLDLWSSPDTFNQYADGQPTVDGQTAAEKVQSFLKRVIRDAEEAVDNPDNPQQAALLRKFVQAVNDPRFSGVLAINTFIDLDELPAAIKGLLPAMVVERFRSHHVAVEVSDIDKVVEGGIEVLGLTDSSSFALVDYDGMLDFVPADWVFPAQPADPIEYLYHIASLQVLFENSRLTSFDALIQLGLNGYFKQPVKLRGSNQTGDLENVIEIQGTYQSTDAGSDDEGIYSFITTEQAVFDFPTANNPYLIDLTETKVQFGVSNVGPEANEQTAVTGAFTLWGRMSFKELQVLDLMSFDSLVFGNLNIALTFDLSTEVGNPDPVSNKKLFFSPGDLTFDFDASRTRLEINGEGSTSLLNSLPLRLTNFIYDDDSLVQLTTLGYFSMELDGFEVPSNPTQVPSFTYGFAFELDLGGLGALINSFAGFTAGVLVGWQSSAAEPAGGVAVGVNLPAVEGKMQVNIQGVIKLTSSSMKMQVTVIDGVPMIVFAILRPTLEILNIPVSYTGPQFQFLLFVPPTDLSRLAWIFALSTGADTVPKPVFPKFLGVGQRIGPSPSEGIDTFAKFENWVSNTLVQAVENEEYATVYQPEAGWLFGVKFGVLPTKKEGGEEDKGELFTLGVIFYDPFLYGVLVQIPKLINFEITYTKVTDDIGKWFIDLSVPTALRTIQAGAVAVTVPSVSLSLFTNGNWRVDVGFPASEDNWDRSFKIQAQAGPIPLIGWGGFYLEVLNSETSTFFPGCNFELIAGAGVALRLGVGKEFKKGILSAGASLSFFGIIEGHFAYGLIEDGEPTGLDFADFFSLPAAVAVKGVLGVIGEIFGKVDFGVIVADVNIKLSANIGVLMQTGAPMELWVEARVSVGVSVKILFVKVSFKFATTVRFDFPIDFTIGTLPCLGSQGAERRALAAAASARPQWGEAARPLSLRRDGRTPAPINRARSLARRRARALYRAGLFGNTAAAAAVAAFDSEFLAREEAEVDVLPLYLFSEVTLRQESDGSQSFQSVFSLGIETSDPEQTTPDEPSDFDILVEKLMRWVVSSFAGAEGHNPTISRADLVTLSNALHSTVTLARTKASSQARVAAADLEEATLPYSKILEFLEQNYEEITIGLLDSPENGGPPAVTIFPVLPELTLETEGRQPSDLERNFTTFNLRSETYQDYVAEYFAKLQIFPSEDGSTASAAAANELSIATTVVQDFFDFLIKGGVDDLDEAFVALQQSTGEVQFSLDELLEETDNFSELAGQVSAYFRGGQVLPIDEGTLETDGLYNLVGQQFATGTVESAAYQARLVVNAGSPLNIDASAAQVSIDPAALGDPASFAIDPTVLRAPTRISPVEVHQGNWTFNRFLPWSLPDDSGEQTLAPFPPALRSAIDFDPDRTLLVDLLEGPAGEIFTSIAASTPIEDYRWATRIDLRVRQVPAQEDGVPTSEFLPNMYQLGGATEANQELIRLLLAQAEISDEGSDFEFHLLYQPNATDTGNLIEGATNEFVPLQVRTNLTTVTRPPQGNLTARAAVEGEAEPPVLADITRQRSFLEILLDGAVTNAGGYLLFYRQDDGEGLPGDLFDEGSGFAPLTLLVMRKSSTVEPEGDPIRRYYTSVVLTGQGVSPDDRVYFALARNVETADISTQAGVVGVDFQIENPDPSGEAVELDKRLALLYSNVGFQIQENAAFEASGNSMPSGPLDPEETGVGEDVWLYRLFLPLDRFAKEGQDDGPYAGVGEPFALSFQYRDTFGNMLGDTQPPALACPDDPGEVCTFNYFDNLVSPSTWPGVLFTYGYTEEPAGSSGGGVTQPNTLFIYQDVDAQLYRDIAQQQPGNPDDPPPLQIQIDLFRKIRFQIISPGVRFFYSTTLNPAGEQTKVELGPEAGGIIARIDEILAYLEVLLEDPTAPATFPTLVIPAPVAGPGPAEEEIFEILLRFGFHRTEFVDELAAAAVPGVQEVFDLVTPRLTAPEADSEQPIAIQNIAWTFEEAFDSLSMAVGDGSFGDRSFYALRNRLLDVEIVQEPATALPTYFAPAPIDNVLWAGTAPVPDFATGQEEVQSFFDVDLDSFNQGLFSAVDAVLEPESAVATARISEFGREQGWVSSPDEEPFVVLSRDRGAIADLYSDNQVDLVFQDAISQPDSKPLAVAVLADQMKAALGAAYVISTLVQLPVRWKETLPEADLRRIQLFGQVLETSQETAESATSPYQLSSAKVPLPNELDPGEVPSHITFTFTTITPSRERAVELALDYRLNYVEKVLAVDELTGATLDSLWLQLVVATDPADSSVTQAGRYIKPIGGESGEPIEIPVPLRQFPVPPTLIGQSWEKLPLSDPPPTSAAEQIAEARKWRYQTEYQRLMIDQDSTRPGLHYNLLTKPSSDALMRSADITQLTLSESLARFNAAFPQVSQALEDVERVAALLDEPNPDPDAIKPTFDDLKNFAGLVTAVRENSTWNPVPEAMAREQAAALEPISIFYFVSQENDQPEEGQNTLTMCREDGESMADSGVTIVPLTPEGKEEDVLSSEIVNGCNQVIFEPSKNDSGWYRRLIKVASLDLTERENAWSSIQLLRNLLLIAGEETNPAFVYQSAEVRFIDPVTPLLVSTEAINIAQLVTPPQPLAVYIETMLATILDAAEMGSSPIPRRLRVVARYNAPILADDNSRLNSMVPAKMVRPIDVQLNGGSADPSLADLAQALAEELNAWAAARELVEDASYIFEVGMFAALSEINQPILTMTNLELALADIGEEK